MTNENKITVEAQRKGNWVERFGVLVDFTVRQSKKGEYVTFKLDCGTFETYGASFNEDAIAFIKDSVGKHVWLKGPLNIRKVDIEGEPREYRSLNVVYFKESARQTAVEEPAELEEATA